MIAQQLKRGQEEVAQVKAKTLLPAEARPSVKFVFPKDPSMLSRLLRWEQSAASAHNGS